MCGIAGYFTPGATSAAQELSPRTLAEMLDTIRHRGPDDQMCAHTDALALGFVRLSIVALEDGRQPIWHDSGDVVMACNGEIYNHRELRTELEARGHRFRTRSDCEVILHLYMEEGAGFASRLNGQFAYAIYDKRSRALHLGRDQAGIQPMFYTSVGDRWVFASEIKALLRHPGVTRELDLIGLDQLMTFPGPVSPRTLFRNIHSVRPGHIVTIDARGSREHSYWDLDFPSMGQEDDVDPEAMHDRFLGHFIRSVRRRQKHAEVPLCAYLSGGLDSSLIATIAAPLSRPMPLVALGVRMRDPRRDESAFQDRLVQSQRIDYRGIPFGPDDTVELLRKAVWHAETPLKESYNAASLALSAAARHAGAKIVLSGEGADELFAGYVGYRFDRHRQAQGPTCEPAEAALRDRVFGSSDLRYEHDLTTLRTQRRAIYAHELRRAHDDFDCYNHPLIDTAKVRDRDPINQRSYLDFKLRLADHLLSDHGDRMTMANSVEGRYPFLDLDILQFARQLAPDLKVRGFTDKFVVRKAAQRMLPPEFSGREKFHFTTPTSAQLLRSGNAEVRELLSASYTRQAGLFDPDWVTARTTHYLHSDTDVDFPFENDWLMTILTAHLLLDEFAISAP